MFRKGRINYSSALTIGRALFSKMKCITCNGVGDSSVLTVSDRDIPKPSKADEVLIKVASTALNRADILQRQGKYPAPKGATDILGLEASGWLVGPDGKIDETKPVMALLNGGGYAEYAIVNRNHLLPAPPNISLSQAASIPEAWLTAFMCLSEEGQLKKGDSVMIYAGASGVGTAAIQISKVLGAQSIVTISSKEKGDACLGLGAAEALNYKTLKEEEIAEKCKQITKGKGFNLLIDCVGVSNFALSSSILGTDSRWVFYASMTGAKVNQVNVIPWLTKRITIIGATLRSRSDEWKTRLVENFRNSVYDNFENGKVKPVIDSNFDFSWNEKGLQNLREAHKRMEENKNIGKIILNLK